MNKRKTIAELKRARALLARSGWIQGRYATTEGRTAFCGLGAYYVVRPDGYGSDSFLYLQRACGRPGGMPAYNDQPGMTKERVLGRFDRAIVLVQRAS